MVARPRNLILALTLALSELTCTHGSTNTHIVNPKVQQQQLATRMEFSLS